MRNFQFYLHLVKKQSMKSWMQNLVKKCVLDVKIKSCERNSYLLSKMKEGGVQNVGKNNMGEHTNSVKDQDNLWSIK